MAVGCLTRDIWVGTGIVRRILAVTPPIVPLAGAGAGKRPSRVVSRFSSGSRGQVTGQVSAREPAWRVDFNRQCPGPAGFNVRRAASIPNAK
jgi:hypothetical protein